MAELTIKIIRADGSTACVSRGEGQAGLVFSDEYEEGDSIVVETSEANLHLMLQLDDALGASLVYLTERSLWYKIPFGEKKICYSPKAFLGKKHYLYVRTAYPEEIGMYRNLALNAADQHGETHCYPHASANVETRGNPYLPRAMPSMGWWKTAPMANGPILRGGLTAILMHALSWNSAEKWISIR